MPKVKTNSGAKKRFSFTGTGKVKRHHAYHSHILTKKTKKQKRDNERREAEAKEAGRMMEEAEKPANGGLLANAKISAEALEKLTKSEED